MFPGLHPAAASMVPPLGMGLAFNTGLQPHVRLGNPAFLSGYYPPGPSYNGVQMTNNKVSGSANAASSNNAAPPPVPPTAAAAAASNPPVQGYGLVSPQDPSMATSTSISAVGASLAVETTHMYIPNASVGAVIGAKGSYIRDLNKYSGYSIKIASVTDDTSGYPAAVNSSDRRVTIVGPPDRFWAVS